MKVCTITFNAAEDSTTVKFTSDYEASDAMNKLDALSTAISILRDEYNNLYASILYKDEYL